MFCLKSICEEIPADESTYIREFFGPKVLGRLPTTTSDDFRLQNTILLLTGSLAEWLKIHPDFLPPVMNYIVPCLSIPRLSMSAASAFSDICDICRESLTSELDSLMHVYGAMANSMIEVFICLYQFDFTFTFVNLCGNSKLINNTLFFTVKYYAKSSRIRC